VAVVAAVQLIVKFEPPTVIVMVCDLDCLVGEPLSMTVTVKLYELGGGLGGVPDNVTVVPLLPPASHDGRPE
jgi:hypothetical protein